MRKKKKSKADEVADVLVRCQERSGLDDCVLSSDHLGWHESEQGVKWAAIDSSMGGISGTVRITEVK